MDPVDNNLVYIGESPDGYGALTDLYWYAVLFSKDHTEVLGEMDFVKFSFSD